MLDDIKKFYSIDKSDMMGSIVSLPTQIKNSLEIVKSFDVNIDIEEIKNIIFCGMGGSGIAGDVIIDLCRNHIEIPIVVNKSYTLPNWANENTLVLIQSYSGDTEEVLNSFNSSFNKKCKIIGFSSNGALIKKCIGKNIQFVKIPEGFLPRTAIGYLLLIPLLMLNKLGFTNYNFEINIPDLIESTNRTLEENKIEKSFDENPSKKIAFKIQNSIPQIYGWSIYSPVAKRYCTQFNENSKLISKYDFIPECNHNDIVGWYNDIEFTKQISCLLFRDEKLEDKKIRFRIDFMKNIFEEVAKNVIELHIQGSSNLSKVLNAIYLGDFISYYTAILRSVDPTPTYIIDELKNGLSKL
jgi:glucose/mannose-6-phosphate isomerase